MNRLSPSQRRRAADSAFNHWAPIIGLMVMAGALVILAHFNVFSALGL